MNPAELLTPDRVRCGAELSSKKRVLEALGELLEPEEGGPSEPTAQQVFESLIGRERLGSTGLGKGVALPHARAAGIERPVAALMTLRQPVAFDAIDHQPVDVVLALLVPEQSVDEHLRILSSLAELFSDTELCERLRQCTSAQELYHELESWQPRPVS